MSKQVRISLRGVSKSYRLYPTAAARLMHAFLGGRRNNCPKVPALAPLDLDITAGETVGIIGVNGSGKSTLLQLVAGVLRPDSGQLRCDGTCAALLELGSGFNPEFSGRENAQLNMALQGLRRSQIDSLMGSVMSFAEIGAFFDYPVKTYSSGMFVRLAFAVAVATSPDILLIDEALAVGDEAFQRKCFARLERFKQRGGTLLFVSHSPSTIVELCDRALLIDGGDLLADGPPRQVIDNYHKLIFSPEERRDRVRDDIRLKLSDTPDDEPLFDDQLRRPEMLEFESRGATIESCEIRDSQGRCVNILQRGKTYVYAYIARFDVACNDVRFGMLVRTLSGTEVAGATSQLEGLGTAIDAGARIQVQFSFRCDLAPGTYLGNAGVMGRVGMQSGTYLARLVDATLFRVRASRLRLATGLVDLCQFKSAEVVDESG